VTLPPVNYLTLPRTTGRLNNSKSRRKFQGKLREEISLVSRKPCLEMHAPDALIPLMIRPTIEIMYQKGPNISKQKSQ